MKFPAVSEIWRFEDPTPTALRPHHTSAVVFICSTRYVAPATCVRDLCGPTRSCSRNFSGSYGRSGAPMVWTLQSRQSTLRTSRPYLLSLHPARTLRCCVVLTVVGCSPIQLRKNPDETFRRSRYRQFLAHNPRQRCLSVPTRLTAPAIISDLSFL